MVLYIISHSLVGRDLGAGWLGSSGSDCLMRVFHELQSSGILTGAEGSASHLIGKSVLSVDGWPLFLFTWASL